MFIVIMCTSHQTIDLCLIVFINSSILFDQLNFMMILVLAVSVVCLYHSLFFLGKIMAYFLQDHICGTITLLSFSFLWSWPYLSNLLIITIIVCTAISRIVSIFVTLLILILAYLAILSQIIISFVADWQALLFFNQCFFLLMLMLFDGFGERFELVNPDIFCHLS